MSLKVRWGDLTRVESVEMPVFVSKKAEEKAFTMLGGKDVTVNNVRHGVRTLKFNHPGKSAITRGIEGTRSNSLGLVIKVKRGTKRKSSSSAKKGSSELEVEVLGKVQHSYKFDNPADFQFLPTKTYTGPSTRENQKVFEEMCPRYEKDVDKPALIKEFESKDKIIVDARPSDFMHRDKSVTAAHADGLFNTEVVVDEPVTNYERKKVKSVAYVLNGGDPIPTGPKQKHVIKRAQRQASRYTHVEVIDAYKRLLALRPVWAKRMLDLHGMFRDAGQTHFFKTMLPYFSFYYKSGPMKDLWCNFGYDPAANASSRLYQVINVRLTAAHWMDIKRKISRWVGDSQASTHAANLDTGMMEDLNGQRLDEVNTTGRVDLDKNSTPVMMFGTLIKRQFACQVVGVTDEKFVEFVREAQVLEEWDKTTGWYTDKTLKLMRQFLLQTLDRKVAELVSKPIQYTTKACILVTGEKNPEKTEHGFAQSVFDWQAKYLALPVKKAESFEALIDNEEELNLRLAPLYRERVGSKVRTAPGPASARPVPVPVPVPGPQASQAGPEVKAAGASQVESAAPPVQIPAMAAPKQVVMPVAPAKSATRAMPAVAARPVVQVRKPAAPPKGTYNAALGRVVTEEEIRAQRAVAAVMPSATSIYRPPIVMPRIQVVSAPPKQDKPNPPPAPAPAPAPAPVPLEPKQTEEERLMSAMERVEGFAAFDSNSESEDYEEEEEEEEEDHNEL
jgi:hypothetical protein